MGIYLLSFFICILVLVIVSEIFAAKQRGPSYDENYQVLFGADHILPRHQGRDVQLSLDPASGAGLQSKSRQSKSSYCSGFFHLRIKLPGSNSAGVVTTFYMTSPTNDGDELDLEFLGNKAKKPHFLQRNVFADGIGGREQRMNLWFDPTKDYHTYRILWNPHQIVFFVDNTPIRVFKNNQDKGVAYPTQPMQLRASIWNGDSWATDGGQTKINWTFAPFEASFRSFGINGCPSPNFDPNLCYSSKFWWNREQYWSLSPNQEGFYQDVKQKYMNYDYCNDRPRYPTPPPECPQ